MTQGDTGDVTLDETGCQRMTQGMTEDDTMDVTGDDTGDIRG